MLVGKKQRRFIALAAGLAGSAFLLAGLFLPLGIFSLTDGAELSVTEVFAQTDLGLNEAAQIGLKSADPRVVLVRIVQAALGFLGLLAVILIIYGGWTMMSSGGNEEKVEKAKSIIKNAVIGLIIILSSFAIVSYILNVLTGSMFGTPGEPNGSGNENSRGLGALGSGIIQSVYPAPGQKDVPRNTGIIVTFREKMDSEKICEDTNGDGIFCNCGGNPLTCDKLNKENIRIFETSRKDACQVALNGNDPKWVPAARADITGCDGNITNVNCATVDNKTYIFQPVNPLGSPEEEVGHTVLLSADLKKENGDAAFGSLTSGGYIWGFEVSTKIDLTPPQVIKGGVFPAPDNERDQYLASASAQAQGSITVLSPPRTHEDPSSSLPDAVGNSPLALINGTYNCLNDGLVAVSLDGELKAVVSGIEGMVGGDNAGDQIISIGCGLSLVPKDSAAGFSAGNSWTFTVLAEKQTDILNVGGQEYAFSKIAGAGKIEIGASNNITAGNIAAALSDHPDIIAQASGNKVSIKAKSAGSEGNSLELSGNTEALRIEAMAGGIDKESTALKNDKTDKPRNSIIQINFNEALNPMTLSGEADSLKDYIKIVNAADAPVASGGACAGDADCLSFKCRKDDSSATDENCSADGCVCRGNNEYLEGKFLMSNQYGTVEFISNIECGVNTCGEKIYCLPANSRLRVELSAASLAGCGEDNCSTKKPFGDCDNSLGGVCVNLEGNKYPLSAIPLDGLADMALNSLDGNRDSLASGPESQSGQPAYNENNDSAGTLHGDDFDWSFFISDKLDLTPPAVKNINPANGLSGVSVDLPVKIDFSKLMLSYSLSTGETVIINQKNEPIVHKLINLYSYASEPIGYWITQSFRDDLPSGGDGEADWTQATLNHSLLGQTSKYRAQAGSGIKDIYQNCFKPCSDAVCFGIPSCCFGSPTAGESCQ